MSRIKVVEKIKTHFTFSNLFSENRVEMSKKYGGAREAADSMASARFMLDK